MLVLKIATGVFIGVLATAVLGWLVERADVSARLKLSHLTPEQVIANCGKPLREEGDNIRFRQLWYLNQLGQQWELRFTALIDHGMHLLSIHDSLADLTTTIDIPPQEQLRRMPCLGK